MGRISALLGALVSPPAMHRSTALGLTERISSVTHLVSSLEYLRRDADRRPGGLNNWQVGRRPFHYRAPRLAKLLDLVADRRVTNALHAARVGAALVLLAPVRGRARLAANLLLAGSSFLLYPRHHYGTDGTDQVSFVVQTATTVARLGERRPQLVDACLWFIALQATLSYAASGWAKLASETWRNGRALPGVMRTLSYGDRTAWRTLERYPRASRLVGAGVLGLESLYPVAYLAGGRLARPLALSAVAFHGANARLMGLGRFVWAFGSMQPAVIYTAGPAEQRDLAGRVLARRDDLVPAVAGAVAAGALAAALVAQAHRRSVVLQPRDHERMMTASSGNRLSYRVVGPREDHTPLIIADHGLAATPEHWEWIADQLSSRFQFVSYRRAGYGRSAYLAGEPYRLDLGVRDLADLVTHVCPEAGRPVILLGHSLGGYLALRAAAALPGRVAAICLVDPSHPAELARSSQQANSEHAVTMSLSLMPASLTLGLGALLGRPEWLDRMPERVRGRVLAHYRDPRMWRAAAREWRATRAEFHAFDGELPPVEVPLLVLTAEGTAMTDPVQVELHDELAKLSSRAERHTVAAADHDEVLTDATAAAIVATTVASFIEQVIAPGRDRRADGE